MKKATNIKILIAAHKPYTFPKGNIYIPIHVGSEGKKDLGYLKDNTGDNISIKNSNYCELTALYWAWKNLKNYDYIGLNHYRRYFTTFKKSEVKKCKDKYSLVLTEKEIKSILKNNDIILPERLNLHFKNIRTKYAQQHFVKDLDRCGEIIKELYPDYLNTYDKVMKNHDMYICNMFVMSKDMFEEYCQWIFPILFKLEEELDISSYSPLQKRIYGFLSERLFNVWIEYHANLKIKTLPILSMEHDSFKVIVKKASKRIRGIKG